MVQDEHLSIFYIIQSLFPLKFIRSVYSNPLGISGNTKLMCLTATGVFAVFLVNHILRSRYICCDGQDAQMEWMISIFTAQVLI